MRKCYPIKEPKSIGDYIRNKRIKSCLKLHVVANLCDITESYMSRIETKNRFPSIRIIKKLQEILKDKSLLKKYIKEIYV